MSTKTVLIPAAGLGTRRDDWSGPKALFTFQNKPAIINIIECYPDHFDVLIGLGKLGSHIESVLKMFYEDRIGQNIFFYETDSYRTPGKGLSHTILDARHLLIDRTFYFHSCDSIIDKGCIDTFRKVDRNAVLQLPTMRKGIYRVYSSTKGWQKIEINEGQEAYCGVAHVKEPNLFWKEVSNNAKDYPEAGETLGLISPDVVSNGVLEISKTPWIDLGDGKEFQRYENSNLEDAKILRKKSEAIWFHSERVIKYSIDSNFISGRVERAKNLSPFVPEIRIFSEHSYAYTKIPGETLSAMLEKGYHCTSFFHFLDIFWIRKPQESDNEAIYDDGYKDYLSFYKSKTISRLSELLKMEDLAVGSMKVNGIEIPNLDEQLSKIPWKTITKPCLYRVHGDLHPDNIIVNQDTDTYCLVDWRQELAGSFDQWGDIYYDAGKLLHGLSVDHNKVLESKYLVEETSEWVEVQIEMSRSKLRFEEDLIEYLKRRSLSYRRTRIIEALVYLNIAPLHEPSSYRRFLFWWGRLKLHQSLEMQSE